MFGKHIDGSTFLLDVITYQELITLFIQNNVEKEETPLEIGVSKVNSYLYSFSLQTIYQTLFHPTPQPNQILFNPTINKQSPNK